MTKRLYLFTALENGKRKERTESVTFVSRSP